VAVQLSPDLRAWVNSLTVSPDGSPQLRLRDDVPVIFGDAVRISEKLIDLATVLTRVDLKDICRIDISVVHNPSVARMDTLEVAGPSNNDFTNRFVQAMRLNKLAGFRKQFRECDALLVDDLHFLASKRAIR